MASYILSGLVLLLFATITIAFVVVFYFQLRAMLAVLKASQLEQAMLAFFKGDLDPGLRRNWGKALFYWLVSVGVLLVVLVGAQAFNVTLLW